MKEAHMILVTAAQMQEMDRMTIEKHAIPGLELMETAGQGAARVLLSQFGDRVEDGVAVICGKGNNGGDGFVIARELAAKDIKVNVFLLAKTDAVRGDALTNLERLAPLKIPVIEAPDEDSFLTIKSDSARCGLLVDAILGTGLASNVRGYYKLVIEFMNATGIPVFAVDIPSGLNSDTGQPCGTAVMAKGTATFALAKIGHYT